MSKLVDLTFYMTKGITPKYTEDKENSCEVLNQKCIRDFSINRELARLNNLLLKKVPEERFLQQYDVLINSTGLGTLGRVAQYFDISDELVTIDSHILLVRSDKSKIDPLFFGYLLKSKQSIFETFAVGSTGQAELSRELVKNLELRFIEDKNKQKEIGEFLLSIDKKIQLNNQINQTLEQMAQALFKSWFVDFDPVKAKIATLENGGSEEEATLAAMSVISGKDKKALVSFKNEQPEKYAELKATAELFPSAMQESELGEIPEGWEVKPISQVTVVKSGYAFKGKDFTDTGFPVIKIKNIVGDGTIDITNCQYVSLEIIKKLDKFALNNGDILLAMTGANVGKVGLFVNNGQTTYLNQRVAKFECKKELDCKWFIYNIVFKKDFTEQIAQIAQGSAQPNISTKEIESISRVIPTERAIIAYEYKVSNFYQLIMNNFVQNTSLTKLRDSLLPKLLSGEISLSEAQTHVKKDLK